MLKEFIIESNCGREFLARELNISRSYLSLLENGKKQPSLNLAIQIERFTKGAVPASSWVAPHAKGDAA